MSPAPAPQRAPLRAGVARCGGGGRASPGGLPSTVVGGAWCQAPSLPRPPVLWSGQPGFRDPCVPGAVDAGVWTQHRSHSVRSCGPALLAVGVAEGRPRGGVSSTVVRGARRQALSISRPPVLWSGQSGFRVPCVPGAVGAGVGTEHWPRSARPCGPALLSLGVAEGRPQGGCLPPLCVAPGVRRRPFPDRPSSGAGSQGSASRVSRVRSVRAWGLGTGPQRAPLRAGVARCGGGRRASPGGVLSTVVRGAQCQALSLSWLSALRSGQPGFRDPCVPAAVGAGVGTRHRTPACALAGRRCRLWGWRKNVPGRAAFHHCEGRLVSGAVPPPVIRPLVRAAIVPRPGCPGCGRCGRGDPAPVPQRVRPCGPALLAVGVAEGRPRGGVLCTVVRGARCQALSLPWPPVLWSVSRVRSVQVWGPITGPRACALAGRRCSLWGWRKGVPWGGAFHLCEGRLVSGAVPPPAARPLERAARVPRPVCPGCGRCRRGDPSPAPQRAPLRAGVARCDGG